MTKSTEEKILQAANLAPSESAIEKIVEVHPMKQVAIMTVVQVLVFGFMIVSFAAINLFVQENKMAKIYESPDKGKTIYVREAGQPISERKLLKERKDEK